MDIRLQTVDKFLNFYGIARKNPSIKFLTEVYTAYFHLPYENITKIIKSSECTSLSDKPRFPDELISDHLRLRTGGTCFSLSYGLHKLLTELGFDSYLVSADIEGKVENHVAVIVIVNDTKFLVDPGFTIPNVIEISEDRITYGHNPAGRVRLEYIGVGRLFRLSNRNQKIEKFRFILKDMPISEEYFVEIWEKTFQNGSLETINICKVVNGYLIRCRNEILTEYTLTGKFQKSIAHNFTEMVSRLFGFPHYLIREANILIKERQNQKTAVG
ncbi:MAG: hypothetical protein B6244_09345 [Candidatus Cloacimonetes bacterium 4572_55]|nr:MAG: hypothetical protein B6244_09345 [Candidatus Cloacimonetes bacterium 4572_55]